MYGTVNIPQKEFYIPANRVNNQIKGGGNRFFVK